MADDSGEDRHVGRERTGPPTWVIVVATLAVAALLAAGAAAWLAWRPDRDDEDAAVTSPPTTAPPEQGTLVEGAEGATMLFRRETSAGIEVRAQLFGFGAAQPMFVEEGEVAVLEDEGIAIVPTAAATEAAVTAPGTTDDTAGTRDSTTTTAPADPHDTNANGVLDLCEPTGDLSGWAIDDETIAQGSTPWVAGRLDELYPSLLWGNGPTPGILAVVLQVGDDVTSVGLRGPDGATDEMAPVRGAVVLAVPIGEDDAQEIFARPDAPEGVALVARRADGSSVRVRTDRLMMGHPAWGGPECAAAGAPIFDVPATAPAATLPVPAPEQPADPAAARAAIEAAVDALYAPGTDLLVRLSYVDDPSGLADVLEEVGSGEFAAAAANASVDVGDMIFTSPTEAVYSYELDAGGVQFGEQFGRARVVDGTWKITRGTWCQDLAKAAQNCPP